MGRGRGRAEGENYGASTAMWLQGLKPKSVAGLTWELKLPPPKEKT
jgi:hypothetical protein